MLSSQDVKTIEHQWIMMSDGVRLAARLWIPRSAHGAPVPAILEYLPYRKQDMVRARDERNHPFFAAHGYACIRVDMRGSGDSEGHMPDMYAERELSDAREVIHWLAAQDWCNGHVGMFGTSWGGTASLQAAVDSPEALKAVLAVCATHDRYENDIHHNGGCLLSDTFEWGATLPVILGLPPSCNVGDDWFKLWQSRLDTLSFPLETWIREEARGTYWRRGSIVHTLDKLSCPVFAVGGWSDCYSSSVMSLVDARPDLVWGLVGPWGHHYPDFGHPGPAIGFQNLALAWWNHWLKPSEDGDIKWPKLQLWMSEFDPPGDVLSSRNGKWIESDPPQDCAIAKLWYLGDGKLEHHSHMGNDRSSEGGEWAVPFDLRLGKASGDTGYYGRYGGLPLDQKGDDARALCFDTDPLDEDYILFGKAEMTLTVSCDAQLGQLSLRLSDVACDGTSTLVAFSNRNLALDDMLDAPDIPPENTYRQICVSFRTKAYRLRKGHRIRLAIGCSYWPLIWPSPAIFQLHIKKGHLKLPYLPSEPRALSVSLPPAIDIPAVKSYDALATPRLERLFQERGDGTLVSGWHQPYYALHYRENNVTFGYETRMEHCLRPEDPLSSQSICEHRAVCERPDGVAQVHCHVTASCDETTYRLDARLTADWNGKTVRKRQWNISLDRKYS